MKKIAYSQISELFKVISDKEKLYIPADFRGQAQFLPYQDGMEMTKSLNTARSAKDLFFPQTENLVGFQVKGKEILIEETRDLCEPFVIFGVRACDARSFEILDRVFLVDPVDTFYQTRREHGTVVTMSCSQPEETCFCKAFNIDPSEPGGDVSCWLSGEDLYLNANTEKGSALLDSLDLLPDADPAELEHVKADIRAVIEKLPLGNLNLQGFDGEHMLSLFNDPAWGKLSESCLGCGTCTFVCPTCQCYDIRDFDTGHGVRRFRCWDSCMYSDFTQMSAGQPRVTQLERFRQRFMHKLVYFPSNNDGIYGCVGCGRCLSRCPISMNIAKVAKTLEEGRRK